MHPEFGHIMNSVFKTGIPVKLSANPSALSKSQIRGWQSSGLVELGLSLNSLRADVHDDVRGIPGEYNKILNLLHELADNGPRIMITFVVTDANVTDLLGLPRLLEIGANVWVKAQLPERTLITRYPEAHYPRWYSVTAIRGFADAAVSLDSEGRTAEKLILIPQVPRHQPVPDWLIGRWSQGLFGPDPTENAHCAFMLNNPHIKEDGAICTCCGRSEDRVLGNVYSSDGLTNLYAQHIDRHRNHTHLPYLSCQYCVFWSYYAMGLRERYHASH
jgi:hypothetical protein